MKKENQFTTSEIMHELMNTGQAFSVVYSRRKDEMDKFPKRQFIHHFMFNLFWI